MILISNNQQQFQGHTSKLITNEINAFCAVLAPNLDLQHVMNITSSVYILCFNQIKQSFQALKTSQKYVFLGND